VEDNPRHTRSLQAGEGFVLDLKEHADGKPVCGCRSCGSVGTAFRQAGQCGAEAAKRPSPALSPMGRGRQSARVMRDPSPHWERVPKGGEGKPRHAPPDWQFTDAEMKTAWHLRITVSAAVAHVEGEERVR